MATKYLLTAGHSRWIEEFRNEDHARRMVERRGYTLTDIVVATEEARREFTKRKQEEVLRQEKERRERKRQRIPKARPPETSNATRPMGAEFRVGRVLGRSFSIFFKNIVPFGLLSTIIVSPTYIYAMMVDPSIYIGESSAVSDIVVFLIESFLGYFVMAVMVYGVFQNLRGRRASLAECMRQGLGRLFQISGVALLSGLLTVLGIVIFIIPGLIVETMLWVVIPVAVVERPGIIASLNRSRDLTKGYRWQVFAILLIALVAVLAAVFVMAMTTELISSGLELSSTRTETQIGSVLFLLLFSGLSWAFMAVVNAVTYNDLRAAKEGTDTEQIAAVFD